MPRRPRITLAGVPLHLTQRGNNHQNCFIADKDRLVYFEWLTKYCHKFQIELHAWVLMDNHVHILATPNLENALSGMMQSLGRQYVRYFNKKYQRSGTLWEGRYKSCLVESSHYLLQCYRYIELNPVRAGMVGHPGKFRWSSYRYNALGEQCDQASHHPEYIALSLTTELRLKAYQSLFDDMLDKNILKQFRSHTNKGLAIGSAEFKDQIEASCQQRVRQAKPGPK